LGRHVYCCPPDRRCDYTSGFGVLLAMKGGNTTAAEKLAKSRR
jgi:hypothetical protein